MKILNTLFLIFGFTFFLFGQNIPIDFETNGNGANWSWVVFENSTNPPLEIVDNPDPTGLNTSSKVAKFTALQAGQPFAGCESLHGSDIGSFTITPSNSIIRIMVWKSVISDVGIKLVRSDNWSLGEIKIANTKVEEWEQLTYDFSSHMGNPYDQIVIFPDFNARGSDNIIYFDEVYGEEAMATSVNHVSENEFSMFPNPASEKLFIQSTKEVEGLIIYSITGKMLISEMNLGFETTLDISDLSKGMYLVETIINGKKQIKKLIKN